MLFAVSECICRRTTSIARRSAFLLLLVNKHLNLHVKVGWKNSVVMDESRKEECKPIVGTDSTNDTGNTATQGMSQVVYRGYVTFENGCNVDGPRQKATICVDNQTNVITVSVDKPASVFVAPGYPIVIEGPLPEEETKDQTCHEEPRQKKSKTKDIFF